MLNRPLKKSASSSDNNNSHEKISQKQQDEEIILQLIRQLFKNNNKFSKENSVIIEKTIGHEIRDELEQALVKIYCRPIHTNDLINLPELKSTQKVFAVTAKLYKRLEKEFNISPLLLKVKDIYGFDYDTIFRHIYRRAHSQHFIKPQENYQLWLRLVNLILIKMNLKPRINDQSLEAIKNSFSSDNNRTQNNIESELFDIPNNTISETDFSSNPELQKLLSDLIGENQSNSSSNNDRDNNFETSKQHSQPSPDEVLPRNQLSSCPAENVSTPLPEPLANTYPANSLLHQLSFLSEQQNSNLVASNVPISTEFESQSLLNKQSIPNQQDKPNDAKRFKSGPSKGL